jgi:kynureninase
VGVPDTSRGHAEQLDAADPLAPFLDRFVAPPAGLIYLDGNSLGMLPKDTQRALAQAIDHEWGQRLIQSWTDKWMELPFTVGDRLGEHLLGAAKGQTLIADSTTVCFYKLASAALHARPDRTRIVTDTANFPTDRYVLEALAAQHHKQIDWLQTDPHGGPEPEQLEALISQDTALVTFSHVSYRSAHIADMRAITHTAHDHGALMLWDLSHTVGSVPAHLDDTDVDLAVGCTYKYLNGGPGAPAFLYVARRLQDELSQPIWGWLGRDDPFAMAPGYTRQQGLGQMLSGTPPVLGLTAASTGIELSIEAGIDRIREKSTQLTEYAIVLADAQLAERHGVTIGSPRDAARRGGHVALVHPEARQLVTQLAAEHDVIADFREPDVVRFGLSPLTTRFSDVHEGIKRLNHLLDIRAV